MGESKRVLSFDMGTRNLAFALVEKPQTILRMGIIDLGKHAARVAATRLIETLYEENTWMCEPGHNIVVELQPGSGVCKTLSHVLQCFFDVLDRERGNEARHFRFMQARQKFKYDLALYGKRNPQTYHGRKTLAIEMARNILQTNDPKYHDFFESQDFKRRTDVADAIVQACVYLQD